MLAKPTLLVSLGRFTILYGGLSARLACAWRLALLCLRAPDGLGLGVVRCWSCNLKNPSAACALNFPTTDSL